jgi:ubiquinone/menaquinone biosynthesis C-methylase UbiE
LINEKRLKYNVKNVKFRIVNAENILFKDSYFDYVICSLVLPYVNNEKVISEIKRVLKKGGRAYLLLHGFGYYIYKFFEDLYNLKFFSAGSRIFVILNTLIIRNKDMQTFQTPYRMKKLLEPEMKINKLSIGGHPLNSRKTVFGLPYSFEVLCEKS